MTIEEKQEVSGKFAAKILAALNACFQDELSEGYIPTEELLADGAANCFYHALFTLAPAVVFQRFTGNNVDPLEINHIANRLCMQFTTVDEEGE